MSGIIYAPNDEYTRCCININNEVYFDEIMRIPCKFMLDAIVIYNNEPPISLFTYVATKFTKKQKKQFLLYIKNTMSSWNEQLNNIL